MKRGGRDRVGLDLCFWSQGFPKAFVFQLKPAWQLGLAGHSSSLEEVHLNSSKEIIKVLPHLPLLFSPSLPFQPFAPHQQHSVETGRDKNQQWNHCLLFSMAESLQSPWQSSQSRPAARADPRTSVLCADISLWEQADPWLTALDPANDD